MYVLQSPTYKTEYWYYYKQENMTLTYDAKLEAETVMRK